MGGAPVTKRMSAKEARAKFGDVLGLVHDAKEPVVIEKKGKPMAVLISPDQYERFQEEVDRRFREAVTELRRRNADLDPDVVLRDVTEAVEEVRREQHERGHSDQ